ncbi:MAG: hypothetical protein JSV27_04440 [Candidatus Bathyarchaeota archaeon]|nr:MAG: hypothetical protein JSV27_04440 [Candidatus Bathyarchaeota archaeon]
MDEEKRDRRYFSDDATEVAEIFEVITTGIPNMIKGVLDSLFSPEAAGNMGKAVAEFRKNLIEGGIPEEEAMAMTREYVGTLTNWSKMIKDMRVSRHRRRDEE